jgi:cobalt transporter subunit CbtB
MAQTAATPEIAEIPTVPLTDLGPWAVFFALLATVVLFFVGADQSAATHEWVHDARHLLGYPCH